MKTRQSFLNKCHISVMIFGFVFFALFTGCSEQKTNEINIGYIGPLTETATVLGIGPANAMTMAVEQYNVNRLQDEPKVNLFIEDGQWKKENALPLYKKLRNEHNIDILFISNSDGVIAVADKIYEDGVIVINPLNNDEMLDELNQNVFKVGKRTEEMAEVVASRITELGYNNVFIFHFPNDFMTRSANVTKRYLTNSNIACKTMAYEKGQSDFIQVLEECKANEYDAYVFYGYAQIGFIMQQVRELEINAPFFATNTIVGPGYYENSESTIVGTEYPFFTNSDGNLGLANEFSKNYSLKYEKGANWPGMQAWDAMGITLEIIKSKNKTKSTDKTFPDWLRESLFKTNHYKGVCGNISINKRGASKGIYFSLYQYESKENPKLKVRR